MKRYEQLYAGFMAVFVTFVVLTNTVGVKLFTAFGIVLQNFLHWFMEGGRSIVFNKKISRKDAKAQR